MERLIFNFIQHSTFLIITGHRSVNLCVSTKKIERPIDNHRP